MLNFGDPPFDRSWLFPQTQSSAATKSHVCNCIGCCPECGSCRTAPWHTTATCHRLAQLRQERHHIIQEAMGRE